MSAAMKKRRQLFKLALNARPANARSKAPFSMATAVRVKCTGSLGPPQAAANGSKQPKYNREHVYALLPAAAVVAFSR